MPHANLGRADLHESKREKAPVVAASTANVSLSTPGSTMDGVTLASGNRILLKNQATASQNGIYVWTGASSALTRATDASASSDMLAGDLVYVQQGTTNGGTFWYLSTSATITLGTTNLAYTQVGANTGTVTSVGLTVPSGFSVTGSPVTTSGTLAISESTQSANLVKAGPSSGGAGAVGYRVLVSADLPSAPTVSGEVTASDFKPSGLTGATAASRYVGATTSGGPASGTFAVGDFVIDQTGKVWICTTAGSPGTWTQVSGSGGGGASLAVNARLRIGSNQSIATATATPIQWDTEDTDSDNQHYTSAANLTGTVAKTASSTTLTGTSTAFSTELSVGQVISVPGTANEVRVVTAIASNTSLTVNTAFANTASGQTATRVNSALVFRTAGFYWVKAGLLGGSATWTAQIRLNGSTVIGEFTSSGNTTSVQVEAAESFSQWDYVEVVVTQSSGSPVNITADQRTFLSCGVSGYVEVPYIYVEDQKAQNTAGGTFTSGADRTRTLNTLVTDTAGIATLASNQVTLPAGTYRFHGRAAAHATAQHQVFLYNATDSVEIKRGSSEYADVSFPQSTSVVQGRFTITGSKAIELRHRCLTTRTTDGFGLAANFGTEVYAQLEFFKVG